ncbi:hypothetical protein Nepgr_012259 [Nepenthes gracilis]|uniref:Uncharacterized protein n=1 Tax=Nepenthes gracilis TaxID=150966 RepID=A0AAD3SFP7_NEPGR|nr:hypothetical protein Nepgr_012259 [Nepenthes gracilis]
MFLYLAEVEVSRCLSRAQPSETRSFAHFLFIGSRFPGPKNKPPRCSNDDLVGLLKASPKWRPQDQPLRLPKG